MVRWVGEWVGGWVRRWRNEWIGGLNCLTFFAGVAR